MARIRSLNLLVVLLILVMGALTTQRNVAFADEPINDNPANSIVVAALPYHTTQDTTEAAVSTDVSTAPNPNDPNPTQFPTCQDNPGYSNAVFYQWTATFTGAVTVDTIGSGPKNSQSANYDVFHDAFTYTNAGAPAVPGTPGTWNEVTKACSDDIVAGSPYTDSQSTFNVTKNMVYYIMLATDGSGVGGNPPPPAGIANLNIYPHDLEFNTNAVSFNTTEGIVMPTTLIGGFTDSDGNPCSSYTISINWGDGIQEDNLPCSGAQTTAAAQAGIVTGGINSVTVTNGGSGYDPANVPTVTFNTPSGGTAATGHVDPLKIVNGSLASDAVVVDTPGSGYDPVTAPATVTISAPTLAPDLTLTCNAAGGETDCQIHGMHKYSEEGTYNISIKVTDNADGTTAMTAAPSTAHTADAALSTLANAGPQTTTQGTATTFYLGTFHDANPLCPSTGLTNDYTAATGTVGGTPHSIYVDWGDGTNTGDPTNITVVPSTGAHQPGPCNFDVSATHTYAPGAPGVNNITTTVTDATSSTGFASKIYLPNVALGSNGTLSVVEGQSFKNLLLGTFTDTNILCNQDDYSVAIDWGDTTSDTLSAPTNGNVRHLGSDSQGTCTFGVYAPPHTYAEEGDFTPTVTVTHGSSSAAIMPKIHVTDAPLDGSQGSVNVVDNGTSASPVENTAFTGVVGTFADTDPNCDITQDYSVSINWGDGTPADTSSGAVTKPGTCAALQVTGTHTYKVPKSTGYAVVVTVTDHLASTQIKSLAVVTDAPLDNPAGATFSATEGTPFAGQGLGTFHDTDPACNASNFTASIIWGDGGTSTATASNGGIVDKGGCVFQVVGGHTYNSEGSLPYSVHVADSGGSFTDFSGTTKVTITDAELSILKQGTTVNGTEGKLIPGFPSQAGYLGTFHDADPNCNVKDFTATVDWGTASADTTSLSWLDNGIVDTHDGNCDFKLFGTFTYTTYGTYPITVTVNDAGTPSISLTDTAKIADAALSGASTASQGIVDPASGQPITPVEGQMFTDQLLGTVTDADPNCDPNNFVDSGGSTVKINWGDGTALDTGKVSQHPGTCVFDVLGSHAFTEETALPLNVVVTVTDAGGSTATFGDHTTVADASLSFNSNDFGANTIADPAHQVSYEGAPLSNATSTCTPFGASPTAPLDNSCYLGTVTDANLGCDYHDYTITVEWGDTPYPDRTTGFVRPHAGGTCRWDVFGVHTFPEEGSYIVKVTATDDGGSTVLWSDTASISDALLTDISAPVKAVEGTPYGTTAKPAVVGTFHDADPGCLLPDYTLVSIVWGDGTGIDTTTGSIAKSADGKPCDFDILGAHTYTGVITTADNKVIAATVYDTKGPINDTTITTMSPLTVSSSVLTKFANATTTGLEGQTLSGQHGNVPIYLGTFTDSTLACNHTYSVSIKWGDGTAADTSTGSTAPSTHAGATPCAFDVFGDHTYAEEDARTSGNVDIPYVITSTVTIIEPGGASVPVGATASISDSPLVALANLVPNNCTLLTSCTLTGTGGTKPLAIFKDLSTTCASEADNAKPHYTVVLKWGDGTAPDASTGVVTPVGGSPCVFNVSGTHTYTKPGTYVVISTITDEGGSVVTTTFQKNSPNTETASTINVTIPGTTKHVGTAPAKIIAQYTHTIQRGALGPLTDYAIDLSVSQYQNGTYLGHLNLSDLTQSPPNGVSIPNCQLAGAATCTMQILSFVAVNQPSGSQAKVGTIYLKYTAPSGTHYVKIVVGDPDPGIADSFTLTMGSPTNDKLPISSSPPTAPTGAVTVVVS